jgi:hypothetical protein
MHVIYFLLVLAGLICFLLGAFNRTVGRVQIVALGLACWIAVDVIARARGLF